MLGNQTLGDFTFIDMHDGRYMLDTIQYGDPENYWVVKGATRVKGDPTKVSAAITRIIEKDVTVGSTTQRRACRVPLILEVPQGFTASDCDAIMSQFAQFVTPTVMNQILLGNF